MFAVGVEIYGVFLDHKHNSALDKVILISSSLTGAIIFIVVEKLIHGLQNKHIQEHREVINELDDIAAEADELARILPHVPRVADLFESEVSDESPQSKSPSTVNNHVLSSEYENELSTILLKQSDSRRKQSLVQLPTGDHYLSTRSVNLEVLSVRKRRVWDSIGQLHAIVTQQQDGSLGAMSPPPLSVRALKDNDFNFSTPYKSKTNPRRLSGISAEAESDFYFATVASDLGQTIEEEIEPNDNVPLTEIKKQNDESSDEMEKTIDYKRVSVSSCDRSDEVEDNNIDVDKLKFKIQMKHDTKIDEHKATTKTEDFPCLPSCHHVKFNCPNTMESDSICDSSCSGGGHMNLSSTVAPALVDKCDKEKESSTSHEAKMDDNILLTQLNVIDEEIESSPCSTNNKPTSESAGSLLLTESPPRPPGITTSFNTRNTNLITNTANAPLPLVKSPDFSSLHARPSRMSIPSLSTSTQGSHATAEPSFDRKGLLLRGPQAPISAAGIHLNGPPLATWKLNHAIPPTQTSSRSTSFPSKNVDLSTLLLNHANQSANAAAPLSSAALLATSPAPSPGLPRITFQPLSKDARVNLHNNRRKLQKQALESAINYSLYNHGGNGGSLIGDDDDTEEAAPSLQGSTRVFTLGLSLYKQDDENNALAKKKIDLAKKIDTHPLLDDHFIEKGSGFAAPNSDIVNNIVGDLGDLGEQLVKEERRAMNMVALSCWLAAVIDSIPSSIMIGLMVVGGKLSISFLISVFISNVPQAFSASYLMRREGSSKCLTYSMWVSTMLLMGLGAMVVGFSVPEHDSGEENEGHLESGLTVTLTAGFEGLSGGMLLSFCAATLLPQAFEAGGDVSGLFCVIGFLSSVIIRMIFE